MIRTQLKTKYEIKILTDYFGFFFRGVPVDRSPVELSQLLLLILTFQEWKKNPNPFRQAFISKDVTKQEFESATYKLSRYLIQNKKCKLSY